MFAEGLVKDKIKTQLQRFCTEFSVSQSGAERLFLATLSENPELLLYVRETEMSRTLYGTTFRVTYSNTDIPVSEVARVQTEAEFEAVMHNAVRGIALARYIVSRGVDIGSCHANFMAVYGAFYSNLVRSECEMRGGLRDGWTVTCVRFGYRIGKVKLGMMERAVQDAVKTLGKMLFAPAMPPETKAYVAHNYLARTVEYFDNDSANALEKSYLQSAYGALINKQCVCQGYAEAYKRILDAQRIPCEVICGKIRGSAEYHAWNAVRLGEEYYHVDVTWDSLGGGKKQDVYFGKSDEGLRGERIWTRPSGVECNGKRNLAQEAKAQIFKNKATYLAYGVDKTYLD